MILIPKSKMIMFVVNAPEFFLSHRLPVAIAAQKAGFEVHVATADGSDVQRIQSNGFIHHVVPFTRSGHNPFYEFVALLRLALLFKRIKPNLVHLVTIKPVLYGGIAARLVGIDCVVHAVSGLGTVFLAESMIARIRLRLVISIYRIALKQKRLAVISQNIDDNQLLKRIKSLEKTQARIIPGSGVRLSEYPFLPEPDGTTIVIMAARLLKDKGVVEFIEAAKLLKSRGLSIEMRLAGSPDFGNPTSVTRSDIDQWKREGNVVFLGHRTDIAAQYAAANIVCLPSYREGLPKCLIEAAACGRAIVTTDVPGCRDAILPSITGLLVPVKDHIALADAIQILINEPSLRKQMGEAGRQLAQNKFTLEKVVKEHLEIYQELIES